MYVWGGGCQVTWFGRADIKLSILHFLTPSYFLFPVCFCFYSLDLLFHSDFRFFFFLYQSPINGL